ncbi:MAG: hypothetical protein V5A61_12180 [Haloarculaceae archaeon]|jgi:hypothetical protein
MRLSETRDRFISELTFPVQRNTVIEQLGDVELDPPAGEPETIGEVLERAETRLFRSPDELYDALISFVGDQYIGRKFYDDRGPNTAIDSEEVSF